MTEKTNTPEMIEDQALDAANGGIALLVPAVQKVREAAAKPATIDPPRFVGGVTVAAGDVNND